MEMTKKKWNDVVKGVEKRLNEAARLKVRNNRFPTDEVVPTDGPFGGNFEFDSGRYVRIEVRSTQALGFAGFDGSYEVFSRNVGGGVIPNITRRNRSGRPLGSHVAPLSTFRRTIDAGFDSVYGYHWRIRLRSRTTTNNQGDLFFRVLRDQL